MPHTGGCHTVIFYFHWFDCLNQILSHVGTFNPFSFSTSILFIYLFKISAFGVGLNISCFAAQQHLSLRSIKYGDCHGPKHVRTKKKQMFFIWNWSFLRIASFPWFIYLFIIIFTRGKDVQGKETITNILAWAESEYKESPSFSKSELPSLL